MSGRAPSRTFAATVLSLTLVSCSGSPSGSTVLTADMPLHLEDHLDAATIVGSEVPAELLEPVEWHFDEPQPDWKPVVPLPNSMAPVQTEYTENALRLTLTEANRGPGRSDGLNFWGYGREGLMWGAIYVDLPDHTLADWGTILVRARTSDEVRELDLAFNLREPSDSPIGMFGFAAAPQHPRLLVINDRRGRIE